MLKTTIFKAYTVWTKDVRLMNEYVNTFILL